MDIDSIYSAASYIVFTPVAVIIAWFLLQIFVINPISYIISCKAKGWGMEDVVRDARMDIKRAIDYGKIEEPKPQKPKKEETDRTYTEYTPDYEISDPYG